MPGGIRLSPKSNDRQILLPLPHLFPFHFQTHESVRPLHQPQYA